MNTNQSVKLSVLIPCYNELDTIGDIVAQVREVELHLRVRERGHHDALRGDTSHDVVVEREIIIVDDGSQDGTRDLLPALGALPDVWQVVLPGVPDPLPVRRERGRWTAAVMSRREAMPQGRASGLGSLRRFQWAAAGGRVFRNHSLSAADRRSWHRGSSLASLARSSQAAARLHALTVWPAC